MQYKNAPIQEALLDIRVQDVLEKDVEKYKELPNRHPQLPPFERFSVINEVSLNLKGVDKQSSTIRGAIFATNSKSRKVQFRKDGFTFNFLRPYTNWGELWESSSNFWEIYKREVRPISINRIALRYINRIELPQTPKLDFDDYFTCAPKVPQNLPQLFNSFKSSMLIPCGFGEMKIDDIRIIITQTFEYNPVHDKLEYIIDLDVFREIVFNIDQALKPEFDVLRKIKNETFESLITEKTRKLFE